MPPPEVGCEDVAETAHTRVVTDAAHEAIRNASTTAAQRMLKSRMAVPAGADGPFDMCGSYRATSWGWYQPAASPSCSYRFDGSALGEAVGAFRLAGPLLVR